MPFFRAHAHIDTKRREPYLLEEPHKGYVRDMLRLRYSLLPVWYTAFREAAVDGVPVLRPHYVQFPKDDAGYAIDDQFYVGGSGLLVKPVVQEEIDQVQVYLADDQPYYDYHTHTLYPATSFARNITYLAPLSTVPLFHQGSSIVPSRQRVRRASPLMWKDPYTLTVALGKSYEAKGELYSDDGDSFSYESGEFIWRGLEFVPASGGTAGKAGVLKSTDLVKERGVEAAGLKKGGEEYDAQGNAWARTIGREGEKVRVEYRLTAGGSALVETLFPGCRR
jgi:alpha 1,3-glucosidase